MQIDAQQLELLELDMKSSGHWDQYQEMLAKGNSPRMAAMLASRKTPCEQGTDRVFWEGRSNENDTPTGRMAVAMAQRAGISTQGKTYVSGLARAGLGPMTPEAWVSGTGDIKKVAEARNLEVEGVVTHKAHEKPPMKEIRLARDIAERMIQVETKLDPNFANKPKQEQIEAVEDKYS